MPKDWIASRGINQKWLANKLGVSEVSVSNWCSGKTRPTDEHLDKLSIILGVDVQKIKSIYE